MDSRRQQALELAKGLSPSPANLERVADAVGQELARWAFQQWALRLRALARFSDADQWLFDGPGLEMATHPAVAAFHASRFPEGVLVADLTTGIGSDLSAFAARGPVLGFEMDSERANLALSNANRFGTRVEVRQEDCLAAEWDFEFAWADPARREGSRRLLSLEQFSPGPRALAARMAQLKFGGMKLSPMLDDRELLSLGSQIEFVSFGGECREAVVWMGEQSQPGVRAVHVESGETLARGAEPPKRETPGRYIYEADPAAIRADALGRLGLEGLGLSNGYLSSEDRVDSPWLTGFEVIQVTRLDKKTLRAELRSLDLKLDAIKVRGVEIDPAKLIKDIQNPGKTRAELLVYRGAERVHAVIARRLP